MKVTELNIQAAETKQKIRLAAYCRVSSDSEDQRHSYAAQIRHFSEYTKEHPEYQLVDIYADEGITGTSMEKRDELLRLLKDCKRGKIDRIITKSISRFARNTVELLTMLRELKELGVTVYFEEQGIDSGKINAELIVTLPGLAAQQESITISQNMRWSYQKRMESGDFNTCYAPYGFTILGKQLVINEKEAKTVRRIFSLYLNGMGKQSIANLLSKEGVPLRKGNTNWSFQTVSYILSNERYMGNALLQKQYRTDAFPFKQRVNHGEKPQYYLEKSNPAIVSPDVFERAQQLKQSRSIGSASQRNEHIFSGKIICPACHHLFRRVKSGKAYVWVCSSFSSGEARCPSTRIREEAIVNSFERLSAKLQTHREQILSPLIFEIASLRSEILGTQTRIGEIDQAIADLSAKNQMLTRLHNGGAFSPIDYTNKSTEIANRLTKLRKERSKLLAGDGEDTRLADLEALNRALQETSPSAEFNEKLFREIVEKITVESNAQLTFHLIGGLNLPVTIDERERCKAR